MIECKVTLSDDCHGICMILFNVCMCGVHVCLCTKVARIRCEFTRLVSSVVNVIVYNSILYKLKTEHNTIMSLKTPFDVMS